MATMASLSAFSISHISFLKPLECACASPGDPSKILCMAPMLECYLVRFPVLRCVFDKSSCFGCGCVESCHFRVEDFSVFAQGPARCWRVGLGVVGTIMGEFDPPPAGAGGAREQEGQSLIMMGFES